MKNLGEGLSYVARLLLELLVITIFGVLIMFALWWAGWPDKAIFSYLGYLAVLLLLWSLASVLQLVHLERKRRLSRPSRAELDTTVQQFLDADFTIPSHGPTHAPEPPQHKPHVGWQEPLLGPGAPKQHGRRAKR